MVSSMCFWDNFSLQSFNFTVPSSSDLCVESNQSVYTHSHINHYYQYSCSSVFNVIFLYYQEFICFTNYSNPYKMDPCFIRVLFYFFVYLFVLRSLSTWLVLTPSLIQNLFVFTLQLQNIFCGSRDVAEEFKAKT
jgi:uncharacterized membrane protein YoaT (DUF817 family)